MSEMIKIKAELLKFCPRDFPFSTEKSNLNFRGSDKQFIYGVGIRIGIIRTHLHDTVTVHKTEYEKAVIDKCLEFCDFTIDQIVKYKRGNIVLMGHDTDNNYTRCVPINADPRPNEESYIIEVDNG